MALVNVPLCSFKFFFIAGLVSLCCDVIFVSCRYCVYLLAATRSLSQCGVFLLFFAFFMTSGEVHVGDIAFSIVDNVCIVVVFIAAVLCVHVACLLVFLAIFQCALYEVCCRLPSFRCCQRGSRSDDFTIGSAGNDRSSVSPGDVLSWWLPCALLPCLCSSFAGDGVYSVSLLLSDVPRVRGVLADVVLYSHQVMSCPGGYHVRCCRVCAPLSLVTGFTASPFSSPMSLGSEACLLT